MAKKVAVKVNEDAIVWKEFTSARGKKYEVGYLGESGADQGGSGAPMGKTDFGISCNWPVGGNDWITTESSFKTTTAISRYKLHSNADMSGDNVGGYAYRLDFSNEEHYDYEFFDQEGDSYRCNTLAILTILFGTTPTSPRLRTSKVVSVESRRSAGARAAPGGAGSTRPAARRVCWSSCSCALSAEFIDAVGGLSTFDNPVTLPPTPAWRR